VKVSERRFREVADAASDIQRLIDEAREIGCLAHKDADADSLGSALAFAEALREMGKSVHTVVPRPLPQALASTSSSPSIAPLSTALETGQPWSRASPT
jgi:c-di-AMP phosphodiesterase-like protein